jgi:hypothetical protein
MASHQQKGQTWGNAKGSQGTQRPKAVGTVVDGEWADQEDTSGLGESPTSCGAKFEDLESRGRRIKGRSVRLELLHAGILDTDLFAKELDLLLLAIPFSPLSKLRVQALRSPTLGQCQGGPGKGDDLDDRLADAPGPASGQREGSRQGNLGHEPSPGETPVRRGGRQHILIIMLAFQSGV